MEQYVIKGGNPLVGEVEIAGRREGAPLKRRSPPGDSACEQVRYPRQRNDGRGNQRCLQAMRHPAVVQSLIPGSR